MKNFTLKRIGQFAIVTFILVSFLHNSSYGQRRIGYVTILPTPRTACIPSTGTVTVSYTISANRSASGTVNGTYAVSGLPTGVTASSIPGFTANGSTVFPNRTLTLTISPSALAGATTFNVKLADGTDQASGKAALILNALPTITGLTNKTVTNDPGICGSSQSFSATSTGTLSYMIGTSNITSPYLFPMGATTVTVIATNSCGSTRGSFDVTVNDTDVPTISTPGDISKMADVFECKGIVTYSVTYNDNCPGATITQIAGLPSGSAFPLGLTKNTFVVTDAAGLTATASFNVTITTDISVNAGTDEQTYYGYYADQTVTRTAVPSGGAGGYSFEWLMDRPLMCNQVNIRGDETFTAGNCTNSDCPSTGSMAIAPLCSGSASMTATLLQPADICVLVSDIIGCKKKDCFHINAVDVRCFSGNLNNAPVSICHRTGSRTNPWIQLCLGQNAAAAHMAQNSGSYLGNCSGASNKTDETGEENTIAEQTGEFSMNVYPNPTNNILNVEFENPGADAYQLQLFDNLGRKVINSEGTVFADGTRISMPIAGMAPGVYYLSLNVGERLSSVKVIVTQ